MPVPVPVDDALVIFDVVGAHFVHRFRRLLVNGFQSAVHDFAAAFAQGLQYLFVMSSSSMRISAIRPQGAAVFDEARHFLHVFGIHPKL